MKFLSLSLLLCNIAVYAADSTNACKNDCEFNPQSTKYNVTTITASDRSTWRPADQLDETDGLIFDNKPVPYRFQDIDKVTSEEVFVLKNDYMCICTQAKENLQRARKAIEQKSATNYEKSTQVSTGDEQSKILHLEHLALHKAKQRLKKYQTILNEGMSYRHICPGFIIPQQTALCVQQWAFLQND